MTSRTSVYETDPRRMVTCHVCTGPGCTKRVLTYATNYRYTPPPTRDETARGPQDRRVRMARVARALELDACDAAASVVAPKLPEPLQAIVDARPAFADPRGYNAEPPTP